MTSKIQREVSRNIPDAKEIPMRFTENTVPLLTAYGCVLIERDTGKSYIYTAVNLKTGFREVISRRQDPLTTSGAEAMVEKIRLSKVAGSGRYEADRPMGEQAAFEKCREILGMVFKDVLPLYGLTNRKEQVSLAHHILKATARRMISLAEAEVGTGKTYAYLLPAIIAKRGRLNGYWNMTFYTGSPYVEMTKMPIVIATSSIALQKAIVTEAIPFLSNVLMEQGVIKTPLTAVIRKGREHYVCERKLRAHTPYETKPHIREILEYLLCPSSPIDLAEVDGLTPYVKRRISVPDRCEKHCPQKETCAYLRFREQASSADIDIQVCNHNYLLADTLRRANEQRPLIPNYQMVIIDEAHKFLQAARSMYGAELNVTSLLEIQDLLIGLKFKHESAQTEIHKSTKILTDQGCRLFRKLEEMAKIQDGEDEQSRFCAEIDADGLRNLRNIRDVSDRLIEMVNGEAIVGKGAGRKAQLLWSLEQIRKQSAQLVHQDILISWVELNGGDCSLCAIPKNLDERLHDDLWSTGIPIILTSGTLSAAGDFSRIKKQLGIERVPQHRVTETSKPSPFDYYNNAMLYISEGMPFPNQQDDGYLMAIANEVQRLVNASHGHAAVLFTSYRAMDMVCELLEQRDMPFPMFRLDRGSILEIERFKQSSNGILFASGAMWEGIDIPGDALSMLIVVKLPFAVPDPISEYEQTLYPDMAAYKECVIIPDMLVKSKQGTGRAIRTETDTAVIAILDSRVGVDCAYRQIVLNSLPAMWVTDSMTDVELFYLNTKPPEYFL